MIHVRTRGPKWVVELEGADVPLSEHDVQEEALQAGQRAAEERGVELLVHGSADDRVTRRVSGVPTRPDQRSAPAEDVSDPGRLAR